MQLTPITLELPEGVARLEPLGLEHAPALFREIGDAETWRYMVSKVPRDEAGMRGWIGGALEALSRGVDLPFVVIDRRDGRVAGTTRFMDVNVAHLGLEIGCTAYGRDWRRTRMNTECKLLLLRHAFEGLGAQRVQLKCDARNAASRAAIERIGATFEGILRRHRVLEDGFVRDTAMYSIIAPEWERVRERLRGLLDRPRVG